MTISTTRRAKPLLWAAAGQWRCWLLVLLLAFCAASPAFALQGATGAHDPSTIVKRNGVYHVWTTGNQIYHMTSTDLVNWTPAAPVFAAGTWPGWINAYVPGFGGIFWAPECVLRNGVYYMYYSCSLGIAASAIGVATSTDLSTWTDQGMLVYTDSTSPWGSIDPAVFTDATGRVWMVFGSHLSGIWTVELNPATGKRLNTTITNIAGTSPWCEHEAPYMMQHGGYYYLFYNKGTCCAGTTSTYYVQMGRSTSPTGPFVDKAGLPLLQGSGTNFLTTRNSDIGPGHVGLFVENGVNYLSYHYYDGGRNGAPTLGITSLSWDAAGWPVAEPGWLPGGTYTITGQGSGKAWAAASCTTAAGQALVQSTPTGLACQQWQLVPQGGSGLYRFTNVGSGLNADQTGCVELAGTAIGLQPTSVLNCQNFRVERAADGSYVLAAQYGNRVIEVPNASMASGQPLGLWDYNGCNCQHWLIQPLGIATASKSAFDVALELFPNPARNGTFTVQLPTAAKATLTVADMSGRVVYRQELAAGSRSEVATGLSAGAYIVRVATATDVATRKLLVL
jgi:arabinan endo-1,5-alpha-L-arabinosidase